MDYDINRIVERISKATYKRKSYASYSDYYEAEVISTEAIPTLTKILHQELSELCIQKAELEAKCFAYEAIISNSNFKPLIDTNTTIKEDDNAI